MKKRKNLVYESIRMVILLFLVSLLAFVLIASSPIDPLVSYIGTESTLSAEAKAEIVEYWGLDAPLPQRFMTWLNNIFHGDMGNSITYKKPVATVIGERFSYSFVLMMISWLISGLIGVVLGIICGLRQGGIFDRIIKLFCLITKSAPTFWLGLMFLVVFAVWLKLFPIGMAVPMGNLASEVTLGDYIYHLILPAITLSVVSMGEIVLYTRQQVVEILNSDFILYAKTRGENIGQIVKRHILRNVLLPAITIQFSSFSELFGGMALAENVFAYPGIGTATTAAALNADAPLLMGVALISAVFVFSGNMIANVLYGVCDPRIREAGLNE
ncbi:peptide/nickel transport system permease protein [Acetitomaculum ruminis DSM 5522]|uniref:Peptide/nickel transport system permease protein n=1 Tax=Acetitomaculum ruminis DSM 5522 TaxID=1120918 RepID=A0A1I0YQF4_9FIRM|nr:ABC transporter permease [Acetitomaculum ruminis]SFB15615.1 peptide/nickel transport system permease protein [Acetitomaculum ruminis DSM 5522]